MKPLDRFIQAWRISMIIPLIPDGASVLDIGCADGALLRKLGTRISKGVGIDPDGPGGQAGARGRLYSGLFPQDLPESTPFDVICLLAVLEHIPKAEIATMAGDCFRYLRPGGIVIATVPSPQVDLILGLLRRFRLIDGMALEQHYGLDPNDLPRLFTSAGFRSARTARFQLGLNNLFVFERSHERASPSLRSG